MADKESFQFKGPGKIPSPEELFHGNRDDGKELQEKSVSVRGRKPIPCYTIVKRFDGRFLILLIVLVLFIMNLNRPDIYIYSMMSSSMESIVPKGSLLVGYETKAKKLKAGDIITYNNIDGVSVTHQIVDVIPFYSHGEPAYWTKGTENADRDQYIVRYADVRGKVLFHIPYIGSFFMKMTGK